MTQVLGYVDAVHHGTAAPSTTNIIWFKTDNNDPGTWNVIDILFWSGSAWISYIELFFPLEVSEHPDAPSDVRKLWKVESSGSFVEYRVYNTTTSTWIPFLANKLDSNGTAVNSLKLEGLSLAGVLSEAINETIGQLFGAVDYAEMKDVKNDIDSIRLKSASLSTGKVLGIDDANSIISCVNNNQINIGIPLEASANIPSNKPILIERNGVGKVIIYSPDGVTINGVNQTSFEIKDQFTACYIRKISSDAWVIIGNVE